MKNNKYNKPAKPAIIKPRNCLLVMVNSSSISSSGNSYLGIFGAIIFSVIKVIASVTNITATIIINTKAPVPKV